MKRRRTWRLPAATLCAGLAAAAFASGCGGGAGFDPLQQDLDVVHEIERGIVNDEESEVEVTEVDMGEFFAMNRQAKSGHAVAVSFQLYGIVAADRVREFKAIFEQRHERLRDAVRFAIEQSEVVQLTSPGLGALKSDLADEINNALQVHIVKGVVFGDFSLEAG